MIESEQAHLLIQAASHEGTRGKQNEDRYAVTPFLTGGIEKIPTVLAVVCDGIGGHRAGEVAAEMGVSIITEAITAGDSDQPIETMKQAIICASNAIYKASQADLGRSGMGATCACTWVINDQLYTANLGDSRIYLLRANHLIQLTTDHTWVQEALDAGLISHKDRMDHPNAHVIRRYLGSQKASEPDFRMWVFEEESAEEALSNQGLTLQPGDLLVLCSDGLTDLVSDVEIRKVL
ncbi:MAG: protein phosphatase 2C domain-containing protein, partial [Chloroflexota bacterium]|nr:protein phosphatase 2C domain-containing protein [Chloroflexota bacterium]